MTVMENMMWTLMMIALDDDALAVLSDDIDGGGDDDPDDDDDDGDDGYGADVTEDVGVDDRDSVDDEVVVDALCGRIGLGLVCMCCWC